MTVLEFDTATVPEGERLARWSSSVHAQLGTLDVLPRAGRTVSGRISGTRLGAGRVSRLAAGPHRFVRAQRHIDPSAEAGLHAALIRQGRSVAVQGGREVVLGAGDVVVLDGGSPFTLTAVDPFDYTICTQPIGMAGVRRAQVARMRAVRFDGRDGMGAVVATLLDSLHRVAAAELSGPALDGVQRTMANLFAILAGSQSDGQASGSVHVERAREVIEGLLPEADLGPALVAARCGISVGHLHRLFAETGTSVAAVIREQRLRRCRAELGDARSAHLTVAEVGARWGYPSPAWFGRAFRARFGCSPARYRAEELEPVRSGEAGRGGR
ncbi:AraC family transcriptional regulator [Pseudonocardia sp. TMWB2A]|uniref:helix-turn-helix domain-containing protein n=1 Tax=Pseudonocardia sp. TMWB2A TaxID=687430 RepID=UPI00307D6608